jgi:uncharacterized membrane protein YqjE
MSGQSGQRGGEGLFASLKNLAATLVEMGRARLELIGNEIETEKLRALRLLLLTQALVFCLGLGGVLAVALVTLLFWDQRIAVLAVFTALFLGVAVYCLVAIQRALHRPERVFSASLAELEEDLRQLKAVSDHETAPD